MARRPPFKGRGSVPFPSLKTDKPGVAPLSNMIPKGVHGAAKPVKDIKVPDGFMVGHSHKQGYSLAPKKEAPFMGGKKT